MAKANEDVFDEMFDRSPQNRQADCCCVPSRYLRSQLMGPETAQSVLHYFKTGSQNELLIFKSGIKTT